MKILALKYLKNSGFKFGVICCLFYGVIILSDQYLWSLTAAILRRFARVPSCLLFIGQASPQDVTTDITQRKLSPLYLLKDNTDSRPTRSGQ
jgi:hypothetical protein